MYLMLQMDLLSRYLSCPCLPRRSVDNTFLIVIRTREAARAQLTLFNFAPFILPAGSIVEDTNIETEAALSERKLS